MGKPSEVIDWAAVERRVGDGTNGSIRAIAREFSIPEATLRKKIAENEWCRDRLGDAMYGVGFALELMVDEWKRLRQAIAERTGAIPLGPTGDPIDVI
jgi:hypothetical protein